MSQVCAWLKKMHPKRSTTRPIQIDKGFTMGEILGTIREEISLKTKVKVGDPILGITSTRTKEVHLISLPIKDLICMREPQVGRHHDSVYASLNVQS